MMLVRVGGNQLAPPSKDGLRSAPPGKSWKLIIGKFRVSICALSLPEILRVERE